MIEEDKTVMHDQSVSWLVSTQLANELSVGIGMYEYKSVKLNHKHTPPRYPFICYTAVSCQSVELKKKEKKKVKKEKQTRW